MAALFITCLTISFELIVAFSDSIARLFVPDKDGKKLRLVELRKASKNLLKEIQTLSPMNEFAKFARVQRKLKKSKTDILSLEKDIYIENAKFIYPLKIVVNLAYALCSLITLWLYRKVPCIQIPDQWVFPFGSLLSFPLMLPGVISVPIWLLICRTVSRTALALIGS
ncbi:guided entry of tail-anchored proteins factor 1-like [Rhopilema esculentum]|uniref:guided entry of tail-anchored proteins factor 1-like n=1 Tax=Rhopilema esculentum TaxID=499914 RepID=UPI0031D0E22C